VDLASLGITCIALAMSDQRGILSCCLRHRCHQPKLCKIVCRKTRSINQSFIVGWPCAPPSLHSCLGDPQQYLASLPHYPGSSGACRGLPVGQPLSPPSVASAHITKPNHSQGKLSILHSEDGKFVNYHGKRIGYNGG
jgi:hypothetical protein